MAGVEPTIETRRKEAVVLLFLRRRERGRVGAPPRVAFGSPHGEQIGGDRITEAKRHEIGGPRLLPMGQIVAGDANIRPRDEVVGFHGGGGILDMESRFASGSGSLGRLGTPLKKRRSRREEIEGALLGRWRAFQTAAWKAASRRSATF